MTDLRHPRRERFTLIELLVAVMLIGLLLAIAVPSYLGFKDRANDTAASANIRAAFPTAEAYFSDNQDYKGMDISTGDAPNTSGLRGIDSGVKLNKVTVTPLTFDGYTLCAVSGNRVAVGTGPAHSIVVTTGTTCP